MTYVCIALIALIALLLLLQHRERRELMLRIQAPHQAVARDLSAAKVARKAPAPISADDDERYKQLREERDGDS